jgi:hypothetical protein
VIRLAKPKVSECGKPGLQVELAQVFVEATELGIVRQLGLGDPIHDCAQFLVRPTAVSIHDPWHPMPWVHLIERSPRNRLYHDEVRAD